MGECAAVGGGVKIVAEADGADIAIPAAFFSAVVFGYCDVVEGGNFLEVRGHLSSHHLLALVRLVNCRRRRGGPLRRVCRHHKTRG